MLDAKILAAVFTTLTAVAATTGGGTVDKSQVKDMSFKMPELKGQNPSDYLRNAKEMFTNKPEPDKDLKANFTVDKIDDDLRLEEANLEPSELREISLSGNSMSSDKNIRFEGFTGKVKLGEEVSIKGNADTILSSGVNISGGSKVNEESEPESLTIEGVEKLNLNYDEVSGTVSSNSTETALDGSSSVEIKSFSGDMRIDMENGSVSLDGKIHSLKAGELKIGG